MTDEITAPEATPAESATAEIQSLKTDVEWNRDFMGENGHIAQAAATQRKRSLHMAAYSSPEVPPKLLPEKVQAGLDSPDNLSKQAAEAMVPAQSVDEYKFNWEGTQDMDVEQLQDQNALAADTCMAIGANPHYAQTTIEYIDNQLSRPDLVPCGNDLEGVQTVLAQRFGANADATLAAAKAACAQMPDDGRQWLFDALSNLDTNGFAWVIGRLASIHNSHR
jgi:hypothetical protein